ncbi:MAG: hypothetical protein IPM33_07465 [Phycisphaerales bacterium]|nr:hypothetical protein [Phycisphaerales bacterium]
MNAGPTLSASVLSTHHAFEPAGSPTSMATGSVSADAASAHRCTSGCTRRGNRDTPWA